MNTPMLPKIQEEVKGARERAMVGKYQESLVFFDGVIAKITQYVFSLSLENSELMIVFFFLSLQDIEIRD
jgi:hypothetical protein